MGLLQALNLPTRWRVELDRPIWSSCDSDVVGSIRVRADQ